MSPFRCFVCFQPCIEFPQDFKALLNNFIQDLNKFQPSSLNCSELNNLIFCQSCWIYFMRVHKFDRQLSFKQETCDAKIKLLSSKIRQSRRSSVNNGNIPTSRKVLSIRISIPPSLAKRARKSQQPKDVQVLDAVYEDKWVPKNLTLPTSSNAVKRLSEVDFIFMDKYPFEATDKGFKCGLCPEICSYNKRTTPLWYNMLNHMRAWHKGNHRVRVRHTLIQIAPNRFKYGKYIVEKMGVNYRCEQCGVMKAAGSRKAGKTSNIIKHINYKHENQNRTFVCECCGKVYRSERGLKEHKIIEHEKFKKQFPCSDCDKIFPTRFRASMHRRQVHLHRGEFVCENCGKRFNQKANLQNHAACVHNEQKVKCKDCGKIFGSRAALYVHRYSHTGKKYTCDVCGMDFTQHYSVTRHKKIAHPQSKSKERQQVKEFQAKEKVQL